MLPASAQPATHVLTLVLPALGDMPDDILVQAAEHAARAANLSLGSPDWLDAPLALDVPCGLPGELSAARDACRAALRAYPIDWCLQPSDRRRKRLLLADMDSTIIAEECLDVLAAAVGQHDAVAAITQRAMDGVLDFDDALIARIGLLKGTPATVITDLLATAITVNPGACTLVATMQRFGATCILVSGGMTQFVADVAARVGFDAYYANSLRMEDGRIAGVAEPILGAHAKLDKLQAESASRGLLPGETLAIGDGANDIEMLAAAGLGIAIGDRARVRAAADAAIARTSLETVLLFQGYRRREFVSG